MRISDWSSDVCSSDLGASQRARLFNSSCSGLSAASYALCFMTAPCGLLAQPWAQVDQVAGFGAGIELGADQFFPGGAAGAGGAGQAEHEGGVGEAGEGARLHGAGADFVVAELAEHFAEAGHGLVEQRQQRFRGGIATGETGAAGND